MTKLSEHEPSGSRRAKAQPAFIRTQNDSIRLLAGTLKRARKPRPLPQSLRLQLLWLARYWFTFRLRGESVIYPGTEKMQKWGECCERTARKNVTVLKAWGVLRPIAYVTGGSGKAIEFAFSIDALWRALVVSGANPSEQLRTALKACNDPHENPAESRSKIHPDQHIMPARPLQGAGNFDAAEKDAEKGATVAPRSYNSDRDFPKPGVAEVHETTVVRDQPEPVPLLDQIGYEGRKAASDSSLARPKCNLKFRVSTANPTADSSLIYFEKDLFGRAASGEESPVAEGASWNISEDARTFLDLLEAGSTTYGAAATSLGWGASRSMQAEDELLKSGLAQRNEYGRTVVSS